MGLSEHLLQREVSRGFRRHHNYIFDYTLRPKRKQIKPIVTKTIYLCKNCANSYDWHGKALDDHLILCHCPYKQDGGRFCIFLLKNCSVRIFLNGLRKNDRMLKFQWLMAKTEHVHPIQAVHLIQQIGNL